jgi:major membrane immunogen (membrane-anchored lipoprotein)
MDTNSEKLIQALEQKFPNGGWKKYIRIAMDDGRIDLPEYGQIASNTNSKTKDQAEGNSITS